MLLFYFLSSCESRPELFSSLTATFLWHRFQPKLDRLPQLKRSEITKTPLFGSKIHNVANGGSSSVQQKGAVLFDFGENSLGKLDIPATVLDATSD